MSQGPKYESEMDALLAQAVHQITDKMNDGGMKNNEGDWGSLPQEPCRYCRQVGGVYFRVDDSPRGKTEAQIVRCDKCGRDWEALSLA